MPPGGSWDFVGVLGTATVGGAVIATDEATSLHPSEVVGQPAAHVTQVTPEMMPQMMPTIRFQGQLTCEDPLYSGIIDGQAVNGGQVMNFTFVQPKATNAIAPASKPVIPTRNPQRHVRRSISGTMTRRI